MASRKKKRKQKNLDAKLEEIVHPGITGAPYYKVMSISELRVDNYNEQGNRGYQRPKQLTWIRKLAREWSDHLCGAIIVAKRPNGKFYVVDGQQRVEAAKLIDRSKIRAMIVPVDGHRETEAFLFAKLNVVNTVKPYDKYIADLARKEEDALLAHKVTRKVGYEIRPPGYSHMSHTITCVQRMRYWAKRDAGVFTRGMTAAAELHDGDRIDNRILNGMCFLESYLMKAELGETVFSKANIKKLKKAGVNAIFQNMDAMAGIRPGNNVAKPQANGIIQILNRGRRESNRIPFIP